MTHTVRVVVPAIDPTPLSDGLAGVFNDEQTDSRRYFEVIKVTLQPPSAATIYASGIAGASVYGIYRISAMSGGTAVSAIERDTDSASLPAQVTCSEFPTSITVTDLIRRIADAPSLSLTGANTWLAARTYGGGGSEYNAVALRFGGNADVEKIILRAGEGIAVVLLQAGAPRSGQINMTIRNASSGATYQFRSRDVGTPRFTDGAMFALLNDSGSGVTLEVKSIELPLDGESNIPGIRLARITGMRGGDSVTPLKHDSQTDLPAALVAKSDFKAVLAGDGVMFDWDSTHGATFSVAQQQNVGVFRRLVNNPRPFSNLGSVATLQMMSGFDDNVLFNAPCGKGIILNPQEGFAVLAGRAGVLENSTLLYCDIEITLVHYPPQDAPVGHATF